MLLLCKMRNGSFSFLARCQDQTELIWKPWSSMLPSFSVFLPYLYCYYKQTTDAVSRCFRANKHFQMKAIIHAKCLFFNYYRKLPTSFSYVDLQAVTMGGWGEADSVGHSLLKKWYSRDRNTCVSAIMYMGWRRTGHWWACKHNHNTKVWWFSSTLRGKRNLPLSGPTASHMHRRGKADTWTSVHFMGRLFISECTY